MVRKRWDGWRRWARPLGLVVLAALPLLLAAAAWHPRLLAGPRGFRPARPFPLRDSLPALSGSLRHLEAFRLTVAGAASGSALADPNRSVWLIDSAAALELEYWTDRDPLDSVDLYLWAGDSLMERRRVRGARTAAWSVPWRRRVDRWVEAVGVYDSHPPILTMRAADSSVTFFDRVEGSRIHLVRFLYPRRRERILPPDTAYPLPSGASAGLELAARRDALAVVNGSDRRVRLRVGRFGDKTWMACEVPARRVHVYRHALRGARGPVLAYTNPGEPYYSPLRRIRRETAYYLLRE